jgi:hypothetical protein
MKNAESKVILIRNVLQHFLRAKNIPLSVEFNLFYLQMLEIFAGLQIFRLHVQEIINNRSISSYQIRKNTTQFLSNPLKYRCLFGVLIHQNELKQRLSRLNEPKLFGRTVTRILVSFEVVEMYYNN